MCCSPWGRKESDTTEWLIELNNKLYFSIALVQNVYIKAYFIHPILKEVCGSYVLRLLCLIDVCPERSEALQCLI